MNFTGDEVSSMKFTMILVMSFCARPNAGRKTTSPINWSTEGEAPGVTMQGYYLQVGATELKPASNVHKQVGPCVVCRWN